MGLTGLDIYKQLPKKNCGECGPPTCLAFAMSLASGKAALDACPYVSDEAKAALDAASAPPIKLVKVGSGDSALEMGDETVLYRHEKTFFHPCGVAVAVSDTLDGEALQGKLAAVADLVFHRVGQEYTIDLVALQNDSGSAEAFKSAAKAVVDNTELSMVLISDDADAMAAAVDVAAERRPLLCGANANNYEAMTGLAKQAGLPLVVKGDGLDDTAELITKVEELGHKDIVIDSGQRETSAVLADLTQLRRLAIKKKFRTFGYPVIAFTSEEEPRAEVLQASVYMAKYASLIVVATDDKAHLLPVLAWRQNIYTDPQKPIQVEAKLHEVGEVNDESPFYVTTNFSLTYYTVEGEVETSKVPSYILPVHTDGTSVLTAWAADKFTGEKIAEAIKASGIEDKVKHREVIIPGYVAVLSGKLQEASGWKVVVGPQEAAGIPGFVRDRLAK